MRRHDPPLEPKDLAILTSLGAGRTLVTLAPEKVAPEDIRRLVEAGVIIAAGHTAIGLRDRPPGPRTGAHGLHPSLQRHATAGRPRSRAGGCGAGGPGKLVRADCRSPPCLRRQPQVAIAAKGTERMMLVTDAMATVGSDLTEFIFQGQLIWRGAGRLTTRRAARSPAPISTWRRRCATRSSIWACRRSRRLPWPAAVPAAFLRLDSELGRIAPGYRASLVQLDAALQVQATWIDGKAS